MGLVSDIQNISCELEFVVRQFTMYVALNATVE